MRAGLLRFTLVALWLLAPAVSAEVYVWTDAAGNAHMTDDLSQVPAPYRRTASQPPAAPQADHRWNAIGTTAAVPRDPTPALAGPPEPKPGRQHVLQVQPGGRELVVDAELEGRVGQRFVVDTGAMLNTIPRRAVQQLGLRIEPETPVTALVGISGQPILAPLVTVRSVRVGSAEVENVEFAVLDTLDRGLLGMPFFNHFRVHTDPALGRLVLEEVDLRGVEGVFEGLDESGWRQQFAWLRYQRDRVVEARRTVDPMYTEIHEHLEQVASYWQQQLDQLEQKASRAGVPRAWRE
jgi:hypothetical protein